MVTFVFLSAGRGTRLWPITETLPKTMVRVLGKPIIEWGVENAAKHADKIVLVIGADGDAIRAHFASKTYAGKIEYVVQSEQKGTAHAVLVAKAAIGSGPFIVLNADTFFDPAFYAQASARAASGKPFVVGKRVEDASPYGLLKAQGGRLVGVEEKPKAAVPGVIFTGCYSMQSDFFKYLDHLSPSSRGELEVTDALFAYCAEHEVQLVEHAGYWNDVGYYWNYLDTSLYALEYLMDESREGVVDDYVRINGKVHIGKGSRVLAGTYIEGPVFIGENCSVGPNAYLRAGTVLEGGNHVGNASETKNSVIGFDSKVPHLSYVGDSILCDNVNLGAGTTVANLKFDDSPVEAEIKGKLVSSLKRKLGCVIGANSRIGVNASINCGVLIGSNCRVYPNACVLKNIDSNTTYKGD